MKRRRSLKRRKVFIMKCIITHIMKDNTKWYFTGFEWGIPAYSSKRKEAKVFNTKKEAQSVLKRYDEIEKC